MISNSLFFFDLLSVSIPVKIYFFPMKCAPTAWFFIKAHNAEDLSDNEFLQARRLSHILRERLEAKEFC